MAATYFQADLDARVRLYLDELPDLGDGTAYLTSGSVMQFMEVSLAETWEEWSDADEGWNLQRTILSSTGSIDASTGMWQLPTSVHKLRSVEVPDGSGWRPLRRASSVDNRLTGGDATAYRTFLSEIEILPALGSTTQLRLTYCPSAPPLISPDQQIPADDGFDDVVSLRTAIRCKLRDGRDASDLYTLASDLVTHFKESIKRRDRASPMKLPMRGRSGGRIGRTRNL